MSVAVNIAMEPQLLDRPVDRWLRGKRLVWLQDQRIESYDFVITINSWVFGICDLL